MAANERNIASINNLIAQGYSQAEIARRVGRDSSLISQIKSGQKPGNNLEGALADLSRSGTVSAPPERRTRATGEQARVRGGIQARTPTGRIWAGGGPRAPRRELEWAARNGKKVKLVIHAAYVRKYRGQSAGAGSVPLFSGTGAHAGPQSMGWDAEKVLRALHSTGEANVLSALRALALERPDVEAVEGVYAVTIQSFDP